MQVVAFGFNTIKAAKDPDFQRGTISTHIDFTDIKKETISLLKEEALKLFFKFSILYQLPEKAEKFEKEEKEAAEKKEKKEKKKSEKEAEPSSGAEISFEGEIVLSVSKEESEQIMKSWEDKKLPPQFNLFIFNLILKRCSVRALQLEDELNLPSHMPMPSLKAEAKKE